MSLDEYFQLGRTITLGSHIFSTEEVKAFAEKYDPHPFHLDEEKAKNSVLGRLCASGWHTCAMWMKYNLAYQESRPSGEWTGSGRKPEFRPSPGFTDLKWLKPVFAGETITFTRTVTGHREVADRPGWRVLTVLCEAFDSQGDKVLSFESTEPVKTG